MSMPEDVSEASQRAYLETRINAFIAHIDVMSVKHWEDSGYTFSPPPTYEVDYTSKKWAKINRIQHHFDGSRRLDAVYAFICLQDGFTKTLGPLKKGDIHKPASWAMPAKTARGNVFTEGFDNCMTPFGINYLK